MDDTVPPKAASFGEIPLDEIPPDETAARLNLHKGRGALSNRSGRFEAERRVDFDDGWGGGWDSGWDDADAPAVPLQTVLTEDATRVIIARNTSPDVPFDRSINPYRGCEHGCVYCFARPSHAYLGLSPGLDFESRLFIKPEAARLLAEELRHPAYRCATLALGTNTDPYQPIERKLEITRGILRTLSAFEHPVCIVTKSALVQRDIDILAPMAAKRMAKVAISITTLDRDLARRLEPRAATPARRLETVRALSQAGIPVSVMTAPMIPALNDSEMEAILEAARDHGARSAGYVLLRVPHEIKDLFREWLETHAPLKTDHVLALLRQTHNGKLYDSGWNTRMTGRGPYAELLSQRFHLACRKLGLNQRRTEWNLDTTRFRPPPRPGDQLSLL